MDGKEVYSCSLHQFMIHPQIDYVIYAWRLAETPPGFMDTIRRLKKEKDMKKQVIVYHGIKNPRQLWVRLLQDLPRNADSYIYHDIRYSFITHTCITDIVKLTQTHDIALTVEKMDKKAMRKNENIYLTSGEYASAGYPVGIKGNHHALFDLAEWSCLTEPLLYYEPYLYLSDKKQHTCTGGKAR